MACSTVTVTKCQAALHTLQAFPFFRPTCLCREPHVDPDCNSFQNFLFDHPCIYVLKKGKFNARGPIIFLFIIITWNTWKHTFYFFQTSFTCFATNLPSPKFMGKIGANFFSKFTKKEKKYHALTSYITSMIQLYSIN